MPLQQSNVRFGLTLANFRRFESIIQAAVLSYPQPVEVDWSQSDLRFTTYIARLRDALSSLAHNPHWVDWINGNVNLLSKLRALVVRPHPTNPSRIIIGDHEATKPQVSQINVSAEISSLQSPIQFFGNSPFAQQPVVEAPKLMLSTSADPEMLQRAVVAYAELASMKVEGLPKFHLIRERGADDSIGVIQSYCDGYDVAVQETEKEFIIL